MSPAAIYLYGNTEGQKHEEGIIKGDKIMQGKSLVLAMIVSGSILFAGSTEQKIMAADKACRVVFDGKRVKLQSPAFVYAIDTSSGLCAKQWKNRLTGHNIDLGGGPELGLDIDAADQHIWITGWRINSVQTDQRIAGEQVCEPNKEQGYLSKFASCDYDDRGWTGSLTLINERTNAVANYDYAPYRRYHWARTHVFLPPSSRNKKLTLTLGGFGGVFDFHYMRVFVNGHEAGVSKRPNGWTEHGTFDLGPGSRVYEHLRFGQDNIIAVQSTDYSARTDRLNRFDPGITRSMISYIPFDQYLSVGTPLKTPELQVRRVHINGEGKTGKVTFELSAKGTGISAKVIYNWNATEPILHKRTKIINKADSEIRLMNVRLGDYQTDAVVSEGGQGFPVYLNSEYFVSLAHPSGWATGQKGRVELKQYPGKKLARGEEFVCMESVLGASGAGKARRAFLDHVYSRCRRVTRGHVKPYAIFEPFGAGPRRYQRGDVNAEDAFNESEDFLLQNIAKLGDWKRETGLSFDFYSVDFWEDYYGDLERFDPHRFPEGVKNINKELSKLGTSLGLWIAASGGQWSISRNPVVKSSENSTSAYAGSALCRATDPIKTMYSTAFRYHIKENASRLIKFDCQSVTCYNPSHEHLPGAYSIEAIHNGVIDTLKDLDAEYPNLFIMLSWGYQSPWWLLYADTLFESGLGIEGASVSSCTPIYPRDSVTVGLDQARWWAEDVPPIGWDSLGVWLSDWDWNCSFGKDRWQEGVVMDICRGNMLAQIWSDHGTLSTAEREQMAEFVALLRARPKCFGHSRFILGNPWKNEPYGYCCSDGKRAFLALNNCTWSDVTLPLKLNAEWGLPNRNDWEIYRWYPNRAKLRDEKSETFGKTTSISLRPFEVVFLEVVPAGERPALDKEFTVEPLQRSFAEPSRKLAISVTRGVSSEKSKAVVEPNSKKEIEQLVTVKGQVPPNNNGGTLVIWMQGGILPLANASGKLAGKDFIAKGVSPNWPPYWQAWLIPADSSASQQEFEVSISLKAGGDWTNDQVFTSCEAHFFPK